MGWHVLRPGDRLTLCREALGRRCGEPLVRIVDVRVLAVRRERLDEITPDEALAAETVARIERTERSFRDFHQPGMSRGPSRGGKLGM